MTLLDQHSIKWRWFMSQSRAFGEKNLETYRSKFWSPDFFHQIDGIYGIYKSQASNPRSSSNSQQSVPYFAQDTVLMAMNASARNISRDDHFRCLLKSKLGKLKRAQERLVFTSWKYESLKSVFKPPTESHYGFWSVWSSHNIKLQRSSHSSPIDRKSAATTAPRQSEVTRFGLGWSTIGMDQFIASCGIHNFIKRSLSNHHVHQLFISALWSLSLCVIQSWTEMTSCSTLDDPSSAYQGDGW